MGLSSILLRDLDLITASQIAGLTIENLSTSSGSLQLLNSTNSGRLRFTDIGTTGMILEQTGNADFTIQHTSGSTGNIVITNTKGGNNSSITISAILSIFSDAIRVGTTTDTTAGNIRWNGSFFEGYTGTSWVRFHDKPVTTLTDGANISWDASNSNLATVTLGGDRALNNPTNLVNGQRYTLIVKQDGTGSRTLDLTTASLIKIPSDEYPVYTTTANAIDVLEFFFDGTNLYLVNAKYNFI